MKTPGTGNTGAFSVRRLTLLSLLTAVLFAQEAALTFLPNIQATFLLVLLYGACVGMGGGTMIVTVHVLLDNLLFGSLSPLLLLPMWVGYEVTLLAGYFLRRRSEYTVCVAGVLCAALYCFLFAGTYVVTCISRGSSIALGAYLVADLPFMALLVGSTALSVLFLYRPLRLLLDKEIRKFDQTKDKC